MPNLVYNGGLEEIAKSATDLDASDLRVLLVTSSYTPDPDHLVVDDVSANEISVTGYARQPLANPSVTRDDATDRAYLDADNLVFAGLSGAQQEVGGAILFRHTGSDATARAISFYAITPLMIGGAITSLTVQWATPANGGVLLFEDGSV